MRQPTLYHFPPKQIFPCTFLLNFFLISQLLFSVDFAASKRSRRQSSFVLSPFLQPSPDDTFIINLLYQPRFFECSLLLFQDRYDSGSSVDRILEQVSIFSRGNIKSTYTIKYTFPHPTELHNIELVLSKFKFKLAHEIYKNISTTLFTGDTLPVHFQVKMSNYRRLGHQCMIPIFMLNDVRAEFMKQIFNMLTPVYIPILRKDEDYFIFKTDPKKHKKLLLMRELPGRTKFKMAVGIGYGNDGKKSVLARTVCFFCEPGGNPRMIDMPVDTSLEPVNGYNYFEDFIIDLNGKTLKLSCPLTRAKIEVKKPWDATWNGLRGNWKILFEEFLTVKFNFTYNMFISTGMDGNWGGGGSGLMLPNGTWIGMSGDVISGKADFGIAMANTPLRIYYIDFTNEFYDIGCLTYVTSLPTAIYSPAALLWPFELSMWGCIGLSIVLSIFFFFSVFKIMKWLGIGCGEDWSLGLQTRFILSTILEQDSPVLPESHALRSFVSLWLFYTMILTTVYRSKMVTLLAFPVLEKLPTTFDELAYSDYKVSFIKHGDSAYNTLKASTDKVYVKLLKEMEVMPEHKGLECLEKVVKGKYACFAYDFALVHLKEKNLSESDTQNLVFAPARTYNVWLGLTTEGKSIYRMNFGKLLGFTRQFHLADIWDKMDMYYNVRQLKLQWWKDTNQTDKAKHYEEDPDADNLGLKHIAGAFYVLFACLLVSITAFGHEMFTFYRDTMCGGYLLKFRKGKLENNLEEDEKDDGSQGSSDVID